MKKNITFNIEGIVSGIPGIYFWEKDHKSLFVGSNEEFAKEVGKFRHPQGMLGKNDCDFFDEFFSTTYQMQDREVMATEKSLRIFDVIKSKKMEEPRICITTKIPKFNKDKSVIGTIGYSIDLTNSLIKLSQFLGGTYIEKGKPVPPQKGYLIGQKSSTPINLTPRESECLFFLLRHKTAKEIAKFLKLSPRTIEYYLNNIKEKFKVQNKSELFDKAEEYGFFNIIPERMLEKEMSFIFEKS